MTRAGRGRSADGIDDRLRELDAIYRDADAAFAGWSCPASTECCRFGVTGREPYVTSIEVEAVRRAVGAMGGKLPASTARRALPLATGRDERICPLLTSEGRCGIYAARPLGCRTFWCDRAEGNARVRQREVNELVRRVKDIAARHRPGGDDGRPLTRALAGA